MHRAIVLCMLVSCLTSPAQEKKQGKYPNPNRFEKSIKAFEAGDAKKMPPEGAVLCVGSSSMRKWHGTIKRDLAPLTVIPRGFGGSNMNDVLHFVDRIVIKYKPRAILLYEGDNDAGAGVPPAKILETFKALVAKVHKALPGTRFYVLPAKPSIRRWNIWPRMQEANKMVADVCARNDLLTYIDIAAPMLGADGKPKKDIFKKDNLHMNAEGYKLWTAAVKPILVKAEAKFEK